MGLVDRIARAHDRALRGAVDVRVEYSTGDEAFPLDATPGARRDERDEIAEAQLSARLMDWIAPAAGLKTPAGVAVTPAKGHTITHTDADRGRRDVWTVLPDANEITHRPADPLGVRVRIHAKLTATEAV